MIKLDLVKDEDADEYSNAENLTAPDEDDNYGTKILKWLLFYWVGRGERVVAADSHFASVKPEKELA